jgi:hypothetical protein
MCEISDFFGMMGGRHATVDQMKSTAGVLMSLGVTDFTSYYSVSLNAKLPPDPALKSRRFSVQEYRQWTDYVSRVNSVLAKGSMVRRTAVLHPIVSLWAHFTPSTRSMYELHPNDSVRLIDESFANLCRDLIQHQVEYDIVDEKSMAAARVEGKTVVIGENGYDVIVLPPMDTIRAGTLETIHRFARAGGTVFAHPLHPQFAAEGVEKDSGVKRMMVEIIARGPTGGVIPETTPIHYLIRSRIPPSCHLTPSTTDVLCTTMGRNGSLVVFLVNSSSKEYAGKGTFRSVGRPIAFDPETGKEHDIPSERIDSTSVQVDLTLRPYGSLFVVFS